MANENVSRTAVGTAYTRAAHLMIDSEPWILEDSIAIKLIGTGAPKTIIASREKYQGSYFVKLRSHVLLRSRFTEDRLRESLPRGVCQYIILGAGLDSFAYRQPAWFNNCEILEIDSHATQTFKRRMLSESGIGIPNNVSLVTIDFESESLNDGLTRNNIDFNKPTFFSWLGVTMYLTSIAINDVLKTINLFPRGSEVVLTYANSGVAKSPAECRAEVLGEKWESKFSDVEIVEMLKTRGFSEVYLLDREDAQSRYFNTRRTDNLKVPEANTIVAAIV
jgi:methyltransferase (TIGR00027 family)